MDKNVIVFLVLLIFVALIPICLWRAIKNQTNKAREKVWNVLGLVFAIVGLFLAVYIRHTTDN